ncbi:MAG TPA: MFS transporter [Roseiflexaceae bacterium]|jgi:MFS family permease|nr:MFS transporter [Roseiflexaceae bacterium]
MQSSLRARLSTLRYTPAAPGAEESAPGALSPGEVRRGLNLSIYEGALATVHVSVVTGAFVTGFALMLGANDFELGLIGAMPFVGPLFQFIGAFLEERLGERRRITVISSALSRVLWAVIAALPFITMLGSAKIPMFLGLLLVSQALIGITSNAWTSWMSDLVPPRRRGSYFGMRNTVCSISAMVTTWLAGIGLDHYQSIGNDRVGYALVFGVAVLCAMASAFVLSKQPEPPISRQRMPMRALFSAPLKNPFFRSFSLASTGWAIATGIASPFFNAYGIQTLHLSFTTLALFGVATSAMGMIAQPFIGRLQDRYGDRRVLIVSAFLTAVVPWGWVLSTPTFLLPVWLTSILAGAFWPGVTQGMLNILMERSPAEGRGAYVATYGTITGAGTCVAGVLGGVVVSLMGSVLLPIGPLLLNHYGILFVATSLGRAAIAWVFARRI